MGLDTCFHSRQLKANAALTSGAIMRHAYILSALFVDLASGFTLPCTRRVLPPDGTSLQQAPTMSHLQHRLPDGGRARQNRVPTAALAIAAALAVTFRSAARTRSAKVARQGVKEWLSGSKASQVSVSASVSSESTAEAPPAKNSEEAAMPEKAPFDPAVQLGAMEPFGFWDPAGFSKVGDEAGFYDLRVKEIKHGRAAMLTTIGFLFSGVGVFPAPGLIVMLFVLVLAYYLETEEWVQDKSKEPGNFGDPAGLIEKFPDFCAYDDAMRLKELNNGRFAMAASIGLLSANLLTGKVGLDQFSGASAGPGNPAAKVSATTSTSSEGSKYTVGSKAWIKKVCAPSFDLSFGDKQKWCKKP